MAMHMCIFVFVVMFCVFCLSNIVSEDKTLLVEAFDFQMDNDTKKNACYSFIQGDTIFV